MRNFESFLSRCEFDARERSDTTGRTGSDARPEQLERKLARYRRVACAASASDRSPVEARRRRCAWFAPTGSVFDRQSPAREHTFSQRERLRESWTGFRRCSCGLRR